MPPKTKYDREAIIAAALEIAKEKGLEGITARSVADQLNSSVAPIYVNFETVEELVEAVVERVFGLSGEILAQQKGESLFENIGKASLAFAREYPVLFRELTLEPNPHMASYEDVEQTMIDAMAEDEEMKDWTLMERKRLLFKMRVFQTGLSALVANGHVPSWLDEGEAERMLMEAGEELLLAHQRKREEKQQ